MIKDQPGGRSFSSHLTLERERGNSILCIFSPFFSLCEEGTSVFFRLAQSQVKKCALSPEIKEWQLRKNIAIYRLQKFRCWLEFWWFYEFRLAGSRKRDFSAAPPPQEYSSPRDKVAPTFVAFRKGVKTWLLGTT